MELFIAWTLVSCLVVQVMGQEPSCFTSGSIAGAVLGTFFATLVALAIGAFIYFKCCHKTSRKSTAPAANVEVGTRGFDNPCFEERASGRGGNDRRTSSDGPQAKREKGWTQFRLLPLSKSTERKAADDSFVTALERIEVPLRGHDFTGLGFNIAGNMRDGIYVKDVLNRGPASESGQITPGDRIESMTVSFRHMVFEDALTILSYASPYDVTLMLEKSGMQGKLASPRRATSAASLLSPNVAVGGNLSGDIGSPGRLVHPLFRSQSIDDLSQIGKADLGAKVSVKLPSVDAKFGHNKLQNREANIEIETPTLEFPTGLEAKIGGGVNMPSKSKTTKFGVKVLPDLKLKANTHMEGIDVPDTCAVSIDTPSIGVSGPSIGGKGHKVKSGIDVNLPSADVNVSVPDISMGGLKVRGDPGLDIENGKSKKSSFSLKMPRLSFGKADADVSAKAPKVKIDKHKSDVAIDIADLPRGKFDADMDTDLSSKINMKMPQINVDVPKGSKKLKGKAPAANISADVALPSAKVDVNLPEAEITGNVKVDKPKFGLKMPSLNIGMPSLNVSSNADSIDGKAPKLKVNSADFSLTKPELEINLPDVDIEAKGGKGSAGLKMPKLNVDVPSAEMFVDPLNLREMSVDIPDMPDVNLSTKGANVAGELSVDMPGIDKADKKGKKSKFSLKMPNINFGKAGAEMSADFKNANVNLPQTEVSLPGLPNPNLDLSIQPHSIEGGIAADINLPHTGKDAKSKFSVKMPSLGKHDAAISLGTIGGDMEMDRPRISAELPDIEAPNMNVKLKIPKPEISANMGSIDGNISMPEVTLPGTDVPAVGIDMPNADIYVDLNGKKSKFGLKMPNIQLGRPNIDLNVKGDLPNPEFGTGVDVDVNVPGGSINAGLDGTKGGKIKLPFKMPNLEHGQHHDVTFDPSKVDITLPNVNLPEIPDGGVSIQGPKVDLNLGRGSLEMPNIKPGIELPVLEGSVEGSLPKVDISASLPGFSLKKSKEMEIDVDTDIDSGKGKKGKFSMKMPSFGFGKAEGPDTGDWEGKIPKAEVSAEMPEIPDVNVSLKGPKAEIDLPDVHGDKKGKKSKFSMKMPHLNLGRTPSGISVEGNLPKSDVEIDTTVKVPSLEVDLPDIDVEGAKGKKSKFSLKMPHMNFGRNTGSEGNVNIDIPNVTGDVDITDAGVRLEGPRLDVNPHEVELSGKGKKVKYSVKLPPGVDGAKVDIGAGISGMDSEMSLKGPEVEIGLKDANLPEMKGKKSKFSMKMPNISFGKPQAEINVDTSGINGKLSKPEFSVSVPDMPDTSIGLPTGEMDVELPEVELGDNKGKKSKFSMKTPNINFGKNPVEVDLKAGGIEGRIPKPELSVTVPEVPDVDVELPDLDIGDVKGKKSKFSMKMPNMSFGKPQADVSLGADGKLPKPEVSVNIPEIPDMNISLKAPGVDIEHPELDLGDMKGKKPKFSMKMPDMSFSKPHAEVSLGADGKFATPDLSVNALEVPDLNISVNAPEIDLEHPELDLSDIKGKKSKFSMKMPSMSFGKPHADVSIGVDGKLPKPEVSVALPEVPDVDISISAPNIDLEHPELDLGDVKGKKSKFSMKMPSFGFEKPQVEGSFAADAKLSKPDVSVNVPEIPDVNIGRNALEVDIDHPELDLGDVKGKKGKFSMKMPGMNFGKPHAEVSLGADAKLPKPELEVRVPEIPDVNIALRAPEVDIENPDLDLGHMKGKKGKFSMKMPNLSFGKPHVEGSLGADGKLPKPELAMNVPEQPDANISLNAPEVELEIPELDLGDMKGKKPKFSMKMPSMSFGKPQGEVTLRAEGKLPQPEVSVAVPEVPDVNLSLNAPEVDVDLPDINVGDLKGKKSKFSMKMPNLGFGKPSAEIKLGADGKLPKSEMSVTVPDIPDASINLKAPEVDMEHPELDLGDLKGKKTKFSMKMPHLHFGKPHADISLGTEGVDAKLTKPEVSLPDVDFSLNAPDIDIEHPDLDLGEMKDKKSKFSMKMPSMNFGKPHADVTLGADGRLPKPELSVNVPEVPDLNISVNAPEVDIDHPDIDLDGIKGKNSKFSMKMPSLNFGKPHIDASLGTDGKLPKPEVSVDVPEVPDVKVSLKAPEVDVDYPELEIGDMKGKKSKFSMKMPHLNFGKPHAEVSIGADGKLPNPELSVNVPEVPDVNISVNAPEIDIEHPELDLGDTKGKKSKFSMKMPGLNFGKPHLDSNFGVDGKLPKPEMSVNVPEVPDVNVSVNAPDVDISHPELDVGSLKGKKSKFSMKMPDFSFGKPHAEVSLGAEGKLPKTAVSVPDVDISVDVPEVDISHPDVDLGDLKGSKSKFSMKMPGLNIGMPHPEVSLGADGKLHMPELSVNVPDVPDVNISLNAPEVDIDHPDIDLGEMKGKKSKFSVKMPNLSLGKPHADASFGVDGKLRKPEVSVVVPEVPDVDVSLNAPSVDISHPDIDLGDGKGKKSKFSMKMPGISFGKPHVDGSLGVGGKLPKPELSVNVPEVPDVKVSLNAPEVEIDQPELDLGDMKGKKSKFSMKMPNLSFGKPHADVSFGADGKFSKPEVALPEVQDVDISLKAPNIDIEHPELDLGDVKGKKSKFSMKMPSLGFGKHHGEADFEIGSVDGKIVKPELSVNLPEVPDVNIDLNVPEVDIDHPDLGELKGKKPKFSMKMPSMNFGKPHAEFSMETGGIEGKINKSELSGNFPNVPDVDISLNAPEVDIEYPDVDLGEMKRKKSKFSMKMPHLNFGKPHAEISPGADGKLPKPEVSVAFPDVPDVDISVNAPDIDISKPELDLGDVKGKKSKFSMKMPSMSFGKPPADVTLGADCKLPKPELSVSVSDVPDVDITLNAPEVDIEYPELDLAEMKGKKGKFSMKMPSMSFGKPHAEVTLGADGILPNPELSVHAPDVDISLKAPEVDIEHPELDAGALKGKKTKFSMKMPNFGKPHADIGFGAEGMDIKSKKPEVSLPDVNVSLNAPDIEIDQPDIDLGEMKGKKSKFSMKMPGMNLGKPHAEVGIVGDGKLAKPGVSVNVPEIPDMNIALNTPEVGIEYPELDLADMKGKKTKFSMKMPGLNFGKPHADVSLGANGKEPKLSQTDMSIPDVDVSLNAPEVDVDLPDIGLGELKGKKQKFSMKMPDLSFGKPHAEIDFGVDGKMPKTRVSINVPEVPEASTSLSAPDIDVELPDLDLGEMKGKKSKFSMKMPHLNFGKPHGEVTLGADGKLAKPELSVNVPEVPDGNISLNAPDVDVEHPELDFGEIKGKKPKFSMKMPGLSFGKPHMDVNLGVDGKLPKTDVSVTVPDIPDANITLNAPEVDMEHPELHLGHLKGKKTKFSMKMPHLNFGGPHAEISLGTEGVDAKLTKPEVSLPDVDFSLNAPDIDIEHPDLDLGEMKDKKSKFSMKMPSMNFGKPHADVTLGADGRLPKPELPVNVPEVPDVNISVNAPEVDIHHPDIDLDGIKGKKSKFSMKMPSMNFGKPHADVTLGADVKLPKPELSVNVPEVPDLNVSVNAPEIDADHPDIDLDGIKGKKSKFYMKMPSLNFGKPHVDVNLGTDGKLPKSEMSVDVPEVPDVNISLKAPEIDIEHPDLDLGDTKGKKSKFSMKMPNLGFGKHHAEVDLQAEDMEGSIAVKGPRASIELPEFETEDLKGKKSKFSIKMPHVNFGKHQFDASVDSKDLNLPEVQASGLEMDKPSANVSITVPQVPDASFSVNAPSVELQSDDLDLPHGKVKKGKFSMKMPHLSFGKHHSEIALEAGKFEGNLPVPSLTASTPSIDLNVKAPSAEIHIPDPNFSAKGNISLPSSDLSASLPEITKAGLSFGGLNADVDLPEAKTKKSKFNVKMPHVSIGKPRDEFSLSGNSGAIQWPPAELNMNTPTLSIDVPSAASSLEGSGVSLRGSAIEATADISSPLIEKLDIAGASKVNVKLPKLQTDIVSISAEVPGSFKSDTELDLDEQKHRLGLKLPKLKPNTLPEANFDIGGAAGLAESASSDQPRVSVAFRAPTFGLKTSTPAVQVAAPALSTQLPSHGSLRFEESPEEDEIARKEPTKKKFSLKFPKLHMGKAHHEIEVDPVDADLNLRVKPPQMDFETDDGTAAALSKTSSDDVKLKKAMKVGVQVPAFSVKDKEDLDASATFKLPRARVSKNTPEEHKAAKLSDKESDDEEEEKPKGFRFGVKLKKSKGQSKSSSKSYLEEPLEIKIPRVDLSKKGSVELEGMEGLSPRDRAEMIKKNAKVSAGVRLPKYRGSLPGEETGPQLLGITRIPSVVENAEQHGYTEMAVDVPEEFLQRERALKGISNIVPSSFKVMVPLMNVQVEDTSKVTVRGNGAEFVTEGLFRSELKETIPKDVAASFNTENVVITDTKGRKAASLGDLTRIVAVNDDSSLERTVSLDLRVGSDAVLSLGTNKRSYPDYPVQDLSRFSAEDLVTSKKKSQVFQNLALGAVEAEDKPFNNAPEPSARSVLAIEVNEAVWNPTSLYVSSYGPDGKALSPNSAGMGGRTDESLSGDTTITLESTPTASSNSSSRTSPLPLTEMRSSFTTVTLSNGNGAQLLELAPSELKNVTFTPVFHQEHVELGTRKAAEEDDDPSASTFAVVRERFEQLSRHSSSVEISKINDSHRVTVETNMRWEEGGSRLESPVHKPVMQIRPVVEEGALSKTVVISGLQLEQCDTSLQEVMSVESPVPTLEKPL